MREGPYTASVGHHGEGEVSLPDGGRIICLDLESAQSTAGHMNSAWEAGYDAAEQEAAKVAESLAEKVVPLRPLADKDATAQTVAGLLSALYETDRLVGILGKAIADGHVAGAGAFPLGAAANKLYEAMAPYLPMLQQFQEAKAAASGGSPS